MKEEFLKYFPQHIQTILNEEDLNSIEEIRIRNNLPLILRFGQAQKILNYIINTEDINYIFQKICENSVYSYQKQIAIVGTAVLDVNGQVANFNYISSLNFRISREIKGCSNCMINELIKNNNSIYNTLLISPPGMRKDDIVA